jgi:hypothetical protein
MPGPLELTDPNPAADASDAAVEAYMTRGALDDEAGDGEDAAPEAAQPREFKYRGKTVKVDPETYGLLEELKNEARGANGRLGSELARLREQQARLEGMVAARAPQTSDEPDLAPPDPMLATRDITAYQRELLAYHDAAMSRKLAQIEQKYVRSVDEAKAQLVAQQREKEWADGFYSQYDHLDDPAIKPVVAQVYTEHRAEIDALGDDITAAHERLAELADARLLRVSETTSGRGKTLTPKTNRPPRVESSAGSTPRGTRADAPREFSTASWAAKQRQLMTGRAVK